MWPDIRTSWSQLVGGNIISSNYSSYLAESKLLPTRSPPSPSSPGRARISLSLHTSSHVLSSQFKSLTIMRMTRVHKVYQDQVTDGTD